MKSEILYKDEFKYLNALRQSGKINMWLSPKPLSIMFHIPEYEARHIVLDWMKWFNLNKGE